MKKLLIALSAAATMAFGLRADGDAGFLSGTDFEGLETGTYSFSSPLWTSPQDDANRTATVAEGKSIVDKPTQWYESADARYLSLKTTFGKPVEMNVLKEGAAGSQLISDGAYFDGAVKFTVCDEAPTASYDKAKIIVWAQESEAGDATNLYVRAGAKNGDDWTTADYKCNAFATADAWHRLTIKSIADVGSHASSADYIPGFVVYIDGEAINCADASYTLAGIGLNDNAAKFNEGKHLFLSMDQDSNVKNSISCVGFDGQGSLDDLTLTSAAPGFAEDYEFFTIKMGDNVTGFTYQVGTESSVAVTANAQFPFADVQGKTITVSDVKCGDGYMEKDLTPSASGDVGVEGWTCTPTNKNAFVTINAQAIAAEFNGKKYATVAEAIAKADEIAVAGTYTLKLNQNVDPTGISLNSKAGVDIIIDLAGQTIEGGITEMGSVVLTITNSSDKVGTVNGVVMALGTLNIREGIYNEQVAIMEGEITGGMFLVSKNAKGFASLATLPAGKELVNNGEDPAYWVLADKPSTFTMTIVTNAKGQYKVDDAAEWKDYKDAVEVEVGSTVTWQYVAEEGYMLSVDPASGTTEIQAGSQTYVAEVKDLTSDLIIAKIGDKPYASLAAAVDAAENGDTITLQVNYSVDATQMLNGKSVTIDLGGHEVTSAMTDNSYVFYALDGEKLVLTNGTITVNCRGVCSEGSVELRSINLTSHNRPLGVYYVGAKGGTKLDKAGYMLIDANSTVTQAEDGKGACALFIQGSVIEPFDGVAKVDIYGKLIDLNSENENGAITENAGKASKVEINLYEGGEISSAYQLAIFNSEGGDINLYGGKVSGSIELVSGSINVPADSTVTVSTTLAKGEFVDKSSMTGDAIWLVNQKYPCGAPTGNIKGGTFTSANGSAIASYATSGNAVSAEFVSGGYFSNEISTDVVEEGFKAVASVTKEGYYEIGADAIAGTGTADDPWIIDSRRHLKAFRNGVNDGTYATTGAFIKQTADIDLRGETWTDIGTGLVDADNPNNIPFNGNYDGQDHVVSNFVLSGVSYCGFFNAIQGNATIQNLKLLDAQSPAGCSAVSILVGDVEPPTGTKVVIENVTVSGNIEGVHNVGGFSAWLQGTVEFRNCTNLANCTTHRAKVGGFSPYYGGKDGVDSLLFENCVNKGTITMAKNISGDATYAVGGILAHAQSTAPVTFASCVNEGAIVGTMEAAGVDKLGNLAVTNFYGTADLGGIMGHVSGTIAVTFTDCVNKGAISADVSAATNQNAAVGGLLGASAYAGSKVAITGATVTTDTTLAATVAETKTALIGAFVANNGIAYVAETGVGVSLLGKAPTIYAAVGTDKAVGGYTSTRIDGDYTIYEAVAAGFKVILTWTDANIKSVNYAIDGATAVAYTSGTEVTATTSVQFYPIAADWYKAQYDGADGDGIYLEATNVVLTAVAIPQVDPKDETKTAKEIAEEAGTTVAVIENLTPGGAGATEEEKKKSFNKAMNWAKANEKGTATIAAIKFDAEGNPDTTASEEVQTTTKAYLFGVAPTESAVESAEAAFKFTAIEPGTAPSPAGVDNANGTVTVQGKVNISDTTWLNPGEEGYDGAKFYRATLTR